jgi:hypothetical protein
MRSAKSRRPTAQPSGEPTASRIPSQPSPWRSRFRCSSSTRVRWRPSATNRTSTLARLIGIGLELPLQVDVPAEDPIRRFRMRSCATPGSSGPRASGLVRLDTRPAERGLIEHRLDLCGNDDNPEIASTRVGKGASCEGRSQARRGGASPSPSGERERARRPLPPAGSCASPGDSPTRRRRSAPSGTLGRSEGRRHLRRR